MALMLLGGGAFCLEAATITGFTPDRGPAGTEVTIFGSGFQTAVAVYFGSTDSAGEILGRNATTVLARVPPNALTGPISVFTTGSGAASSLQFFIAAPRIGLFTPQSGGAGIVVTVSGDNFATGQAGSLGNVTNVLFNGQPAAFVVNGINQLLTLVPTNATSGPITVINAAGSGSSLAPFEVAALITGFSPTNGMPGDPVTIQGQNLASALRVEFGFERADFTVTSTTNLVARVPTNAVNGRIQITTPAGATSTSSNFVVTPRIIRFTPTVGSQGTNVAIEGGGFHGVTDVEFNGVRSAFTYQSPTRVTAVVPAGATSGPLRLLTTNGSYTTTDLFHFAPRLISVSPSSGRRDDTVTLDGQNLAGTTLVLFNGVPAPFIVVSATRLTATVPGLATTGRIAVVTPAGEALSGGTFNVIPVLDNFAPGNGPVGTPVVLHGAGLTNLTWVRLGDLDATFTIGNSTNVRAIVPLGAFSGPFRVRNVNGIEVQAPGIFFVDGARPTLDSFSPTNGTFGTKVLLQGAGLRTTSRVQFNGVEAAFTVRSSTQVEATVPADTASGLIAVTTVDGIALSRTPFVIAEPSVFLTIERGIGTLTLRWSATATGYALEVAARLEEGAAWTPVAEPPVLEGGMLQVTLPLPSQGETYFRLRK